MKKFKGYMLSHELEDMASLDKEQIHCFDFSKAKMITNDIPVTITEGHDEPIDQTALGFFLGFLCGMGVGFVVILYSSTIPLGQ